MTGGTDKQQYSLVVILAGLPSGASKQVRQAVQAAGCTVECDCETFDEACARCADGRADVLVVDWCGACGQPVVQAKPCLPTVILAPPDDEDALHFAQDCGAGGMVAKPFSRSHFMFTLRKLVEQGRLEQVAKKRQSLDSMMQQAPVLFWSTDDQLRFTNFGGNQSWRLESEAGLLGMPLPEYLGENEGHERAVAAHRQAMEGEQGSYDLNWWDRCFHCVVGPLREQSGDVTGVVGVAYDQTEQKQHEDLDCSLSARFHSIFKNSLVGIATCDPSGRLLEFNKAFERLTGYAAEELRLMHFKDVTHPEDSAFEADALDKVADGNGHGVHYDKRIIRKDGGVRWVSISLTVARDAAGRALSTFALVEDVTWRKLEEERRAFQMEREVESRTHESLGVFAGGIAHDFNNLLMTIMGNADLAHGFLPTDSPSQRYLEEIRKTTRDAAELCRKILGYSGQGQVRAEAVDLSFLLNSLLPQIRVRLCEKNEFELSLAHNLPPIQGDPTQICRAVMSLTDNAKEAIGDAPGCVSIETGRTQCDRDLLRAARGGSAAEPGSYAYLRVADDGCGMTEDQLLRAFDPFYSTKFAGRGLGLAETLGAMRSHRGAILAESAPGKGSSFTLLFPFEPAQEERAGQVRSERGAQSESV
jgi:PAS domain S-box-containing protein